MVWVRGWVRFRGLLFIFLLMRCFSGILRLPIWVVLSFCCNFRSAWNISFLFGYFFLQILSILESNSPWFQELYRFDPSILRVILSSHSGYWYHFLPFLIVTLLFDLILKIPDLFLKLSVDFRDIFESFLIFLNSLSFLHSKFKYIN